VLQYIPLLWNVSFEDLEPADLNERIWIIGVVLVACQKPVLDALHKNDAAAVGCSGCVHKLLLKLRDELVEPRCTGLAEVKVKYGLGLGWVHCVAPHRRFRTPTGN
jgi:DNA-directed RNA polymerase subunit RPC12/RpoP